MAQGLVAIVNAKLQIQAAALGPINFLDEEEAVLAAATTEGQVGSACTCGAGAWVAWCNANPQNLLEYTV